MITCLLSGRCGNIFYTIGHAYAYSLQHHVEFQMPSEASHCDGNNIYFHNLPFKRFNGGFNLPKIYDEPTLEGAPYYHEIPFMHDVCFRGYYQSDKYLNPYRKEILEAFKIPIIKECQEFVSIHVRRGDYLTEAHFTPSIATLAYYQAAVKYFVDRKQYKFFIFSDDIPYCKTHLFTKENFGNGISFVFSEGKDELTDLSLMSSCSHNILALSSFSFVAAWLNRNPDKIIICPDKQHLYKSGNLDMIPDNYIQLPF